MPYHSGIQLCNERYREGLGGTRNASIMNCSVWLLISKVWNAAIVTSVIAPISLSVSFLSVISGFTIFFSFLRLQGIIKDYAILLIMTFVVLSSKKVERIAIKIY